MVGAGIDAGFAALMGSLGVATIAGGASGLLATAIYAAYVNTDLLLVVLVEYLDKISDFLKIRCIREKQAPVGPKSADLSLM